MSLLPVEEALARILAGVEPLASEEVPIAEGLGRTLACDLTAKLTQPPWDNSAMDGYAVRAADVGDLPARLRVIGNAPAGHGFPGEVGPAQAVRIFTGAPLPRGADTIIIQEDTEQDGEEVVIREAPPPGRFIRRKGLDFSHGEALLAAGHRLSPRDLALAAAMGWSNLPVRRRPVIALLATGDELVPPGELPGPDQIVASNGVGIAALVSLAGGQPLDLGIAPDQEEKISGAVQQAVDARADILVTLGGASVGEHDLVQAVLTGQGMSLGFWRIAMRPGKPLMFGHLGAMRVLGLPGNPVSALVCARLFLVALIGALLGRPAGTDSPEPARLGGDLPANDRRQDYLRARLDRDAAGTLIATPFPRQDSSMLATLAHANCLVVRPPHAPASKAGDPCEILRIDV